MQAKESSRRVFVTGFGAVSPLDTAEAAAFPRTSGETSSAPNQDEERGLVSFEPGNYIPEALARRMDRFTQIGYVAVKRALEHARLDPKSLDDATRERTGTILNTCYGPFESTTGYLEKVLHHGAKKAPAAVFPNTVYNAFTGKITIDLGVFGTNSTISGSNPLTYGYDMISQGHDDIMLVGGCEELSPKITQGFRHTGYLAKKDSPSAKGRRSWFWRVRR